MQDFCGHIFAGEDRAIDAFGFVHFKQVVDTGAGEGPGLGVAGQFLAGGECFANDLIGIENSAGLIDDERQLLILFGLHGGEENFGGERSAGEGGSNNGIGTNLGIRVRGKSHELFFPAGHGRVVLLFIEDNGDCIGGAWSSGGGGFGGANGDIAGKVADDSNSRGAGIGDRGIQKGRKEFFIELSQLLCDPECFDEAAGVCGFRGIKCGGPFAECRESLCGRSFRDFASGSAAFGECIGGEGANDGAGVCRCEFDAGSIGGAGCDNAIDTAVEMIATRVAEIVLHVSDNGVLPVENVKGTVTADLHIAGAEVGVGRIHNRFNLLCEEAATLLFELILGDSLEANHVGNQEVPAVCGWESLAVEDTDGGHGADAFVVELSGGAASGDTDVITGPTGAIGGELIAPLIEHIAMGIGADWEVEVDIEGDWVPFVDTGAAGAEAFGGAPRRFEGFRVEDSSGEIKLSAGAHRECVGRVMGICGIQSVKDSLPNISAIVAIDVFEEEDVGGHRDKHATVPKFEPGGVVQSIGEGNAAIGNTVSVVIGEDQKFVIHRFQRIPVRICGPCRDPQPAVGIDCGLYGVDKVRKHFFGGEEVDFHAGVDRHFFDGFFST